MNPKPSQPTVIRFGNEVLDRMAQAVERVQERIRRSTSALASAGVPFAIGGSNATSIWIAKVDESAVRNARNVELVLFRADLDRAVQALTSVGFITTVIRGNVCFQDGPAVMPRTAITIAFGAEPISERIPTWTAPSPTEREVIGEYCVVRLERLVEFQLARYQLDDAVDLRDLIDVGLVDASWPAKYVPELGARLQHLLDTPDG